MKVEWSAEAQADLVAIREFVSSVSREAARRLVARIVDRTVQLSDCPFSGATVPNRESMRVRELIEHGYRILYAVGEETVVVLAVIHGRRKI